MVLYRMQKTNKDNAERKCLKCFRGLTCYDPILQNDQHTQKICWLLLTICLSLSRHFVESISIIKGLRSQILFVWKVLALAFAILSSSLKDLTKISMTSNLTDGNIYYLKGGNCLWKKLLQNLLSKFSTWSKLCSWKNFLHKRAAFCIFLMFWSQIVLEKRVPAII